MIIGKSLHTLWLSFSYKCRKKKVKDKKPLTKHRTETGNKRRRGKNDVEDKSTKHSIEAGNTSAGGKMQRPAKDQSSRF